MSISKEEKWKNRFAELCAYKAEHGNCEVNYKYHNEALYRWVCWTREWKKKGKLSETRINQLNDIKFRFYDSDPKLCSPWNKQYSDLIEFIRTHRRWPILGEYSPGNERRLAKWSSKQRMKKSRNLLGSDKVKMLDSVGIDWDPQRKKHIQ